MEIETMTQNEVIDLINRHADVQDMQSAIQKISEAKATFSRLSEGYGSGSMASVADGLEEIEAEAMEVRFPSL